MRSGCFRLRRNVHFDHARTYLSLQLMYKKELAAHFDAGVAIDSVFFENCELPQSPDEGKSCEEEQWQCLNKVFTH